MGRKTKERTKERKELRRLGGRIPALDMVEYSCKAGPWEAEAGKPQVPSWPGPHVRKTLSPKTHIQRNSFPNPFIITAHVRRWTYFHWNGLLHAAGA